jgi:hypothetical protein
MDDQDQVQDISDFDLLNMIDEQTDLAKYNLLANETENK